jgi:uncharacterized damage-inducible protein DinB
MNILQRLFIDLEFAPREHIVRVPLAYVGVQPAASHHSIFEELWHLTKWQTFVLRMACGEAVRSDYQEEEFPDAQAPETEEAWKGLVTEFLTGSAEAVSLAGDEDALRVPLQDGLTVRERLELLAVHNAYHLGKIVLLRQLLGIWVPPLDDADA